MKADKVKKLLKPILSEAPSRLHDKIKEGFYALRDWALENPFIKEVEVTQFVKVPEIVRDIYHVETVEKIVEKLVTDPDQKKKIERLQKRVAKLEDDVKEATWKCETSAAIAFLRYEINIYGLTPKAFDAWIDALVVISLAECVCVAARCMCVLAYSSDSELKVTLDVGKTALGKAVRAWVNVYYTEMVPQSDREFLGHIIQERHPGKLLASPEPANQSDKPQHNSWLRYWATMGGGEQ
jgi:hypothetical protein